MSQKEIKVPRQERGIATRNKILEAGRKLFSEKGFYKTNSKEIAKAAGVATGTFYIYFKDKKPLFLEVFEIYYEQIIQDVLSLPALQIQSSNDAEEFVGFLIDRLFAAHEIEPEFHRELIAMTYSDKDVRALNDKLEKKTLGLIEEFLQMNRRFLVIEDYKAASRLFLKTAEEIIHSIKIFGSDVPTERMLNELKRMLVCYFFGTKKEVQ